MSNKSNDIDRAYEYIFILTLNDKIKNSELFKNTAFEAAFKAWQNLDSSLQNILKQSSFAGVMKILDLEPKLSENKIRLFLQTDENGECGDVRDIVLESKDWQIGISCKHNHFAVKHSRLSKKLDFAKKWFNVHCSDEYWQKIEPIFAFLQNQKGKKWSDLTDKSSKIYKPLLIAFKDEIIKSYTSNKKIPQKLVEYLLGIYDFYKLISLDNQKTTQLQSYNLHGQLGKAGKNKKSSIIIPLVSLPDRIVLFDFKPNSENTLELYLNNGWQFSFRIHNASTYIEPSLKFDIQIIGMPTSVIVINIPWFND